MDDSAVSCQDRYMSGIYDDITGTVIFPAYSYTGESLRITGTGKAISEMSKYLLSKSRTVNSICQTVSAIYIWISDKLTGICHYGFSSSTVIRNIAACV